MTALPEPVARILRYAGRELREVRNPGLTAREAIVLADYLVSMLTMSPEQIGEFMRHCETARLAHHKAPKTRYRERQNPPS
jgi:hypothetical protein